MQKRYRGFTLIVVLFFLQLISLLTIYQLLHASENIRRLKRFHVQAEKQYAAKLALLKVENELLQSTPKCEIEETPAIYLKKAHVDFWQQHACMIGFGGERYYYVIERLAADYCALIANLDNNKQETVQYFRVTLAKLENKIILQSTLAKPGLLRLSCPSGRMPHKVYLGSQMRRILTA